MNESTLEQKIARYVKSLGGRAFKWISPGTPGVPDRIIILPGGRVIFAEIKRPGTKDGRSIRQVKIFKLLKLLGCDVWLVSDFEDFKERLHGV